MENISYYGCQTGAALLPAGGVFSGSFPASVYTEKKSHHIKISVESFMFKYSLSLTFVLLMWLSANSFFYLPFTPVPFTMQVFTVLFASFCIGPAWSFVSQIQYILLGIAGVPLFSGFKSGLAALMGPSGGYIMGFAISSVASGIIFSFFCNSKKISGNFCRPVSKNNSSISVAVFLTAFTSLLIIYSFGYIHLAGLMYITAGSNIIAGNLLFNSFKLGIVPFVLFDLLKIMGVVISQKLSYKTE